MTYKPEQQLLWVKLLILAGKDYRNGVFAKSNGKPVEEYVLLKRLDVRSKLFKETIERFVEDEMIEIEDGVIKIKNWNVYQDIEKIEQKRANDRAYQKRKYEERKKEEIQIDPEMQALADMIKK